MWSPLGYGGQPRDVVLAERERLILALVASTRVDLPSVLVHTAPEVHHHLGDIERGLAAPA